MMTISKEQSRAWAMHAVGSAVGGILAWKYVGGFWATLGGIILGGMAGGGVGALLFAPTSMVEITSGSGTPVTAATLASSTNDTGARTSDPFAGMGAF